MRPRLITALAVVAVLFGTTMAACAPRNAANPQAARANGAPLVLATSTTVLQDLIRNVAGDGVEVLAIVPRGSDPHDYSPTPQDAVTISRASVFFANGLNQEQFLRRLIDGSGNRDLKVVTLSDGLKVLDSEDEESEQGNPHLWLSARNAMTYAERIRDTLKAVDPANAARYDQQAGAYLTKLDALDRETLAAIATIPQPSRKLVTFHDSMAYFCDRYGMEDFAILTVDPEAEPSAFVYAQLVQQVRSAGVKAIFGEAGFSSKLVEQLAKDTGAKFVPGLYTDTLGETSETGSYLGIMRSNTRLIVENLR